MLDDDYALVQRNGHSFMSPLPDRLRQASHFSFLLQYFSTAYHGTGCFVSLHTDKKEIYWKKYLSTLYALLTLGRISYTHMLKCA